MECYYCGEFALSVCECLGHPICKYHTAFHRLNNHHITVNIENVDAKVYLNSLKARLLDQSMEVHRAFSNIFEQVMEIQSKFSQLMCSLLAHLEEAIRITNEKGQSLKGSIVNIIALTNFMNRVPVEETLEEIFPIEFNFEKISKCLNKWIRLNKYDDIEDLKPALEREKRTILEDAIVRRERNDPLAILSRTRNLIISENREHYSLRIDLKEPDEFDENSINSLLQSCLSIHSLHLSNLSEDTDSLSSSLLKAILHLPKLKHLTISSSSLSNLSLDFLCEVLHKDQLTAFHLSKAKFSSNQCLQLSEALKHSKALKKFSFENCSLTHGIVHVIRSLTNCPRISELYLSRNSVDEEAAQELVQLLKRQRNIKKLHLARNLIQSKNMKDIISVLDLQKQLMVLYICGNEIDQEGYSLLLKTIKELKFMALIAVDENMAIRKLKKRANLAIYAQQADGSVKLA